jgi:Protein of unknown function (DUF3097)
VADGILSGPIDLDAPGGRPRPPVRAVAAEPGLVLTERATGVRLVVVRYAAGTVTVRDGFGEVRPLRDHAGRFSVDGEPVTLVPAAATAAAAPARTASGSVAGSDRAARVARASRILVEGVHDAELVEKVWGDDLRHEGIVVERLDGADHLDGELRTFRPGPGRRLGVLLDHLVDGSKESRIAAGAASEHVLVLGHPYVDIWQAVRPGVVGIDAWPEIPRGTDWKSGVCAAVGWGEPRDAWRRILASLSSWTDLETPLVNAVEQLIDFVAEP